MSKVVGLNAAEPDPWDSVLAEGAEAALRKVLARRPLSIVIAFETRGAKPDDVGGFEFVAYPPGTAAGFYIMKRLAEERLNDE